MPLANSLARAAIKSATIRTSVTPPVRVDPFAAPGPAQQASEGGGGLSGWLLGAVAPTLDLETAAGPVTIAPWGEPKPMVGLVLGLGLMAGAGALALLVWRGLTASRRPRRRSRNRRG